jgi:hypothetical protein
MAVSSPSVFSGNGKRGKFELKNHVSRKKAGRKWVLAKGKAGQEPQE